MGSFIGHILPGSFFLVFGIWWTIQITRRYHVCKTKSIPFYCTVAYPCFCFCMRIPFEGIVKMFVTSIGMVGELVSAFKPMREHAHGRLGDMNGIYVGDIQHVSMYFFFFIAGLVDILMSRKGSVLPRGVDYVISFMAFTAQYTLFKFHVHGQGPLEMTLHLLLLYAIAGSAVTCLIEYNFQSSILAAYARAFMVFLQGTWFYQVGFILYPPFSWQKHWDQGDHDNIMFAVAIFNWHVILVLLLMCLTAGITYYCSSSQFPTRKGTDEYEHTANPLSVNRKQRVRILESESSDEETMFD